MEYVKPSLTALMLALSLASAGAQEQAPAAPPGTKEAAADADVKPSPRRKPVKRRSVLQVIEPTRRTVTDGYRPTLIVRPPAALPGPVPPPTRMNSCDAGGCFDTGGARYNGGVGPTLLSPQGQLCTKGAVTIQCF